MTILLYLRFASACSWSIIQGIHRLLLAIPDHLDWTWNIGTIAAAST
jgi:hypothetical protein